MSVIGIVRGDHWGDFDQLVKNPPKSPFRKGDFSGPCSPQLAQSFELAVRLTPMHLPMKDHAVMPVKTGIQAIFWIPASAGMTMIGFRCSL